MFHDSITEVLNAMLGGGARSLLLAPPQSHNSLQEGGCCKSLGSYCLTQVWNISVEMCLCLLIEELAQGSFPVTGMRWSCSRTRDVGPESGSALFLKMLLQELCSSESAVGI